MYKNIKLINILQKWNISLLLAGFLLSCFSLMAQPGIPLDRFIFDKYPTPQSLFEAHGKDINTESLDLEFSLDGSGFRTTDTYDDTLLKKIGGVPWDDVVTQNPNLNDKITIKDLRLLNNNILVGYVNGTFWEPSQMVNEVFGFIYGFGAITQGSLSELNYDVKIDWGGNFAGVIEPAVYWNPVFLGLYPWPNLGGIIPPFPKDDPAYNTYRQSVKVIETRNDPSGPVIKTQKILDPIEKIFPPEPQILFNLPKWASVVGALKYPSGAPKFELDIRSVTGDPVTGKFGVKGGVNPLVGKGKLFGIWPRYETGPGWLAEVEILTKPHFAFNAIGFGGTYLRYPLPSVPPLHLQEIFAGLYNIEDNYFYVKGETEISVWNKDVPGLKWIPAYGKASVIIKANGYLEGRGNAYLLGFSMSDALMYLDLYNKKFHTEMNNLPAPPFLIDGKTTASPSGFSMDARAHLTVPKSIPVIGGLSVGGVNAGIDARSDGTTDIYANAGLQIAKIVPKICSPVKVTWNVRQQFCTWRSCCWRWWWGACGSGCPSCNWGWLPKFEWKTVCTDPIPANFGQFRVGIKFANGDAEPYYKPLSGYNPHTNFFERNYLKDYPEWENPFYSHITDELGRTQYYNYNWDIIEKVYSTPQNAFQPSVEIVKEGEDFKFSIDENKYEHLIVRINYENALNEAKDVSLLLPTGELLQGVVDNKPFGYADSEELISCTHQTASKELFYYLVEPAGGEYVIQIANSESLGQYTVEVLNQDRQPTFTYGLAGNAANRDGAISKDQLKVEMMINDLDTDPKAVYLALHLDTNKQDYDGVFVESITLSDLQNQDEYRFDTDHLSLNPGMYYAYVLIDDQRNTPVKKYLDGRVFIQKDDSPDPVEDFSVAPIDGGFELTFSPNPEYIQDDSYTYEILIMDEDRLDDTSKTMRLVKTNKTHRIGGLTNGNSYLVSPIAVDGENNTSSPKNFKRIVPGLTGYRKLDVKPREKDQATVGYHFNTLLEFRDGDILSSFNSDYDSRPDVAFGILGDTKGAEISSKGIFSWLPNESHIGANTFEINIQRLEILDPNDTSKVRVASSTIATIIVDVVPGDILLPLSKNNFSFLTMPVEMAVPGSNYSYKPEVSSPEELGHSIWLIEGPEGMKYDEGSKSIIWDVGEQRYGSFVEIALLDNDLNKIDTQRWFVDVATSEVFVNDNARINGYRRDVNQDGEDILKVIWDAPENKVYSIVASDSLEGEWRVLSQEPIAGGISHSFELPLEHADLSGAFLRIVPFDGGN